jgi:putative tryptophan/tyrosine transport system ATP-binding protein
MGLSVKNISKSFVSSEQTVKVLDKLSFELQEPGLCMLIGANGSGKSTLMNCLAGNLIPDEGSIVLNQQEITKWDESKRASIIARVLQNPLQGTASGMKVIENMRLAALRGNRKSLRIGINNSFREQSAEKIKWLGMGLENRLDARMNELSGGQRQALCLIMAVLNPPRLLLLDEPSSALDPRSSEQLMMALSHIVETMKLHAIMITHNYREAAQYGHSLMQIKNGQIARNLDKEAKSRLSAAEIMNWL